MKTNIFTVCSENIDVYLLMKRTLQIEMKRRQLLKLFSAPEGLGEISDHNSLRSVQEWKRRDARGREHEKTGIQTPWNDGWTLAIHQSARAIIIAPDIFGDIPALAPNPGPVSVLCWIESAILAR